MDATVIDLVGAYNARAFGGSQPWLVRSAALDAATQEDAAALRDLGVGLVLDLREPGEGAADHGLPLRNVPLYRSPDGAPTTGGIEEIYELLLRTRGHALAEAVGAIADAEGAVLVHCTAGKDRTGLVVALALLVAGSDPEQIVADYALSESTVAEARREHVEQLLEPLALSDEERAAALRLHLRSPEEAMRHAIALIDELGGARAYLLTNGLDERQLDALAGKAAA
jgi:protein-tyrosine phosphatase